jgi:hypothetical protein
MKLSQIICEPDGKVSHGKVWSNIAFTIASFVIVKLALVDSTQLPEMFLWYLVVVSGSELGKKFMTMKLSNKESKE